MVIWTHVEEERPAHRLEIDLLVFRFTTIFPSTVRKHVEIFPLLFLMSLNPLKSFAIYSRLELQDIKKTLVLAFRICLQSSQQFDSSTNAMRKIRPSRNRDHLALILVLALPRLGLASSRAISDFAAPSASFGVDGNLRKTECCSLLAFNFRCAFVETPCAGVLQYAQ